MLSSRNDEEVFGLLERVGKISFNPAIKTVFDFEHGDHYFLLIYCPGEFYRGSFLFQIEKKDLHNETEHELLPAVLSLPDDAELAPLKTGALLLIEQIISGRKRTGEYYDAH